MPFATVNVDAKRVHMGTEQTLIWTTTSGISFLSHPDCDLELYVECKNGHVTFLWRQLRTRSINANANFSKNDYRVVEPNAGLIFGHRENNSRENNSRKKLKKITQIFGIF